VINFQLAVEKLVESLNCKALLIYSHLFFINEAAKVKNVKFLYSSGINAKRIVRIRRLGSYLMLILLFSYFMHLQYREMEDLVIVLWM
jgi:hypothetical protein